MKSWPSSEFSFSIVMFFLPNVAGSRQEIALKTGAQGALEGSAKAAVDIFVELSNCRKDSRVVSK